MIKIVKEYFDERAQFFAQHKYDYNMTTSPMDEYGRYFKTYTFSEVEVMTKNYSEAHHRAINKYRDKTYKAYNVVLRNEEDSDLIEAIETAKANKVTIRGWLRSVYESGYTEEQLIEAFGNFRGVMTPETVKRILASIKR